MPPIAVLWARVNPVLASHALQYETNSVDQDTDTIQFVTLASAEPVRILLLLQNSFAAKSRLISVLHK